VADLNFTDDVKKKLKGLMPFTQGGTIDFTPPEFLFDTRLVDENRVKEFEENGWEQTGENVDKFIEMKKSRGLPAEFIPVFKIRAFNQKENNEVSELLRKKKLTNIQAMEYARKVCLGWENLFDLRTGNYIEYEAAEEGEGCKRKVFETIPDTVAGSLARAAGEWSGLYPAEKLGLKS